MTGRMDSDNNIIISYTKSFSELRRVAGSKKTPTVNAVAVWDDGEGHTTSQTYGGTGVMDENTRESIDNAKSAECPT